MTYNEIMTMMQETGLPYAYDHFAEGESPEPPFAVFLFPTSNNFGADNRVWQKINRLRIEVYTDYKQPNIENQIETVLDQHGLYYDKTEVWIQSENLYEVAYEMEVIQHE